MLSHDTLDGPSRSWAPCPHSFPGLCKASCPRLSFPGSGIHSTTLPSGLVTFLTREIPDRQQKTGRAWWGRESRSTPQRLSHLGRTGSRVLARTDIHHFVVTYFCQLGHRPKGFRTSLKQAHQLGTRYSKTGAAGGSHQTIIP